MCIAGLPVLCGSHLTPLPVTIAVVAGGTPLLYSIDLALNILTYKKNNFKNELPKTGMFTDLNLRCGFCYRCCKLNFLSIFFTSKGDRNFSILIIL